MLLVYSPLNCWTLNKYDYYARTLFISTNYSTIIHALISCRLDYCNSILYNAPRSKTHLDKIDTKGTYYPSFEKITLAEDLKYI